MKIRKYQERDFDEVANLFYNTVITVNAKDYTQKQVALWENRIFAPDKKKSFLENYTVVATENGKIVGFGDIDKTGYLDRLFVHNDYQRMGIATAICNELEQKANKKKIIVHASITAKPFFESRGYILLKEQQIELKGILFPNYVMEKIIV